MSISRSMMKYKRLRMTMWRSAIRFLQKKRKKYLSFNRTEPLIKLLLSKGGDLVAFKITDECVACGTCAEECPSDAINEGDDIYDNQSG